MEKEKRIDLKTVRRRERTAAFYVLFAWNFSPEQELETLSSIMLESGLLTDDPRKEEPSEADAGTVPSPALLDDFSRALIGLVSEKLPELDDEIAPCLKGWRLGRLSRAALTVLRISCAELKYRPDVPTSVSINEAVELCKTYAAQEDARFINGVLRTLSKKLRPEEYQA
ncbi:MAG: transcription antitermination factor NusB [Clostridia bacterium]|nr:transcription antitermination factor NusB [Clostridia bacterium]